MPQGIYNTEMLKQQYDPVTGEELYMKISYDENGRPQRDIVRKSQITQEDIDSGNARVYYDYEGIPMEGLLAETWNFTKSLVFPFVCIISQVPLCWRVMNVCIKTK